MDTINRTWPAGTSEMAERFRAIDWASTPLGPISAWPQSLRTAVDLCLGSQFPAALVWGSCLTMIHNEAHVAILGTRYPTALGRPAKDVLSDSWPVLGQHVADVLATGDGISVPDLVATLDRGQGPRTAHFAVSFGPVPDESGQIAGVMISALETTERVHVEEALSRSARRTRAQQEAYRAAIDGAPLGEALGLLSRLVIEETAGEARTAFYIADPEGACLHPVWGAGTMPDTYLRRVDGFCNGMDSLARGLAVPTGRPVVTPDVFAEPRWGSWVDMAAEFDYRGCWSFPIKTRDRKAVGTFAMYFRAPREATPNDLAMADEVTQAAAVVIAHHAESQERSRAESALRESEAKFRTLFESIDEGYCVIEMLYDAHGQPVDWVYLEANPTFERQSGLVAPGNRVSELVGQPESFWFDTYQRVLETGEPERVENHVSAIDRWYSIFASRIGGPGSHRLAIIFDDVTARKTAEENLRESERSLHRRVEEATTELRTLSRRLLAMQEDERRRLSRELYDEIGQLLTGLQIQIASAGRAYDDDRGTILEQASDIVQELTSRVSELSMDLRPAALDTLGLLPSLLWHIERYQATTGIPVDFRHEGLARRFPAAVEITGYRVVQEGLANVARHAQASSATIQLLADDRTMTVMIRDTGQGFELGRVAAQGGLSGMRERVELLGGTLSVESGTGTGTTITAEIPIVEPAQPEVAP